MSLKDRIEDETERRRVATEEDQRLRARLKTYIPKKCAEFVDWVEGVCEGSGIKVDRKSEKANLYFHSSRRLLGEVALDCVKLRLFENYLNFEPEEGLGYVGAIGKISIKTNVRNWETVFDLAKQAVFIPFEDEPGKLGFRYIDHKFNTHEFTKESLEKLIEAILVG